jgi:hypothetical protein
MNCYLIVLTSFSFHFINFYSSVYAFLNFSQKANASGEPLQKKPKTSTKQKSVKKNSSKKANSDAEATEDESDGAEDEVDWQAIDSRSTI